MSKKPNNGTCHANFKQQWLCFYNIIKTTATAALIPAKIATVTMMVVRRNREHASNIHHCHVKDIKLLQHFTEDCNLQLLIVI